MNSSTSPSPSSAEFAESLFVNDAEHEKHGRGFVGETLLPDTTEAPPRKRLHFQSEECLFRPVQDVVQETPQPSHVVIGSSQPPDTGAALIAQAGSDEEDRSDGSEEDGYGGAQTTLQGAAAPQIPIPQEWTAGNGAPETTLSLCFFLLFTCMLQSPTAMGPSPSTLIGQQQLRRQPTLF